MVQKIVTSSFLTLLLIGGGYAQMIVQSSDGQTELMRVDENGDATIAAKTTTVNMAITGNTPRQGKVLFSNDNAGNLRWSLQPTTTGQYLSWNATTKQWEIAEPPVGVPGPPGPPGQGLSGGVATRVAFWTGENSMGHDAALYWDNSNNRLGVGTSSPSTRFHVNGAVRLQGLSSNSSNTRVLVTDTNGNVRYRTLSDWSDNQGLSVGAGSGTTSIIDISGSSSDVTLSAGSNVSLSENGNTITISATGGASYWQRTIPQQGHAVVSPTNLNDYVGIGTAAAQARLHVDGTVRFVGLGTNTSNVNVLTTDGIGNVTTRTLGDWSDNDTVTRLGVGGSNYSSGDINFVQGTGISLSKAGNTITVTNSNPGSSNYWQRNSGNLAPSTISDNLGLGTTSPVGRLDVRGNEVRIWDGSASVNLANEGGDLYVEHQLEVDGQAYIGQTVAINTITTGAALVVQKPTGSELARFLGIQEKVNNTRLLSVDANGYMGYNDISVLNTGTDLDGADIEARNNTTTYEIDVKTHDYLELYLYTAGQNDNDDGGRDEDDDGGVTISHFQLELWNGSSWQSTSFYESRSVTCGDDDIWVEDHYYKQWFLDTIPDNSLIRFKVYNTNPVGQDNYHDTVQVGLRFWSHDGNHLNQTIINTL